MKFTIVKVYTHTCIWFLPQVEVMTTHTVAFTMLTEKIDKSVQRF